MSALPPWPEPIKREGPYKVYKGHQYTVYDDGNSAETPYQTDLAEAALARLRIAEKALNAARACLYEHGDERYTAPVVEQVESALSAIGSVPNT